MSTPLPLPSEAIPRFSFDRERLAQALGYLTTGSAEFFRTEGLVLRPDGVRDSTDEFHVWVPSELPAEPQVTVTEAWEWLSGRGLLPAEDALRCFNVRTSVYPVLRDGFGTDYDSNTEDARMVVVRGPHHGYGPPTATGAPDFLAALRLWPEPAALVDVALFAGLAGVDGEHFLCRAESLWREGMERLAVDPLHRSMGAPRPGRVSWTWLRHRGDRPVVPWRSHGPTAALIGSDFRVGRYTQTGTADYPRPAAWQELSRRGVSLGYLDDTVAELTLQRPEWAKIE